MILIYSPFPNAEAAQSAARALLEKKLIACANILPAGQSLYWWNNAIEEATETVLIAKTDTAHTARARAMLLQLHPYDNPAILSWPAAAEAPYLTWLTQNLGD